MKITKDKIITETSAEILTNIETELNSKYNKNFKIKSGGILDNILQVLTETETSFQDNLVYFTKQFNPETCESIWQDALQERLGVSRLEETSTTFTKEVKGTPNSKISQGAILIRSEKTAKEFTNSSDFTTDEKGNALVQFTAVSAGEITIEENETFKIIRAPSYVEELSNTLMETFSAGRSRETDDVYRIRFANSKAQNSQATARANISNLGKYVNDAAFLSIHDKNTDLSMDANCVRIIVKHNTTDQVFAQAILDTFGCGIQFIGSTSVTVKDSKNKNVHIKFSKAVNVPIEISAKVKITDGEYEDNVIKIAKEKIIEYIDNRIYGLGNIIYATELILPLLTSNIGIDAVEEIKIKRIEDEKYTDIISLEEDEAPEFTLNQIYIEKEAGSESN